MPERLTYVMALTGGALLGISAAALILLGLAYLLDMWCWQDIQRAIRHWERA